MNNIRDKACLVGIGQTEFSRNSGRSELQLACEAIKAACDDAGLPVNEIDGLVRYDMDSNTETMLVSALGLKTLRHWESISYGGGAANATIAHAVAAVAAGYANNVICFRAMNGRSGRRLGQGRGGDRAAGASAFHAPYGLMAPAHSFGMFAARHMHQYGTTSRHFGWVAVTLRKHASRNPNAIMRTPITIEEHQSSPYITYPLRRLDFCLENDGAVAILVTSPERAKALRQPPVYVVAAAQASGPFNDGMVYRPDISVSEAAETGRLIWERSGLTPRDVDVFLEYDHFTPFIIFALEAYGFVKPGEGKDFVEGGQRISFDGELPINTHGGNHSEAYIHGLTHVAEAVRLLRGTSTSQPPKKKVEVVLSGSTTAQLSAAVLLRK
ncbi:MAG: lipid-transfer protein [Chloroflexi bacterium]|nr:lipid-transfer protein [Chloroflexota bacterium]